MASRPNPPEVGSPQWIFNELADAHRKEADHFEDFTIAFRNELEWLTEHMADVFTQGSTIDITELYKTPGKLRGKTPRNPPKTVLIEEQKDDNILVTSPARIASPICLGHDVVIRPMTPQLKESFDIESDSAVSTPELMRDSGSSAAGSFGLVSNEPIERSSPAKVPSYQNAPDIAGEIAERRTCSGASRNSSTLAEEDCPSNDLDAIDEPTYSETSSHDASSKNSGEGDHDLLRFPSPLARIPTDLHADSSVGPSSSQAPKERVLRAIEREASVSPVQASNPVAPSSPISPIQKMDNPVTPKPLITDVAAGSDTPSETASPTGVARSSMNFASLPARETLTYKKSMGGSNPTGPRSSHVDDRASLFGRLTGGKSLGASSIAGEIGITDTPSTPGPISIVPGHHHTSDEEDEDEDLNEQLRLAEMNKASVMQFSDKNPTQRLDEKIRQLSQQSTSRLSKSISASSLLTTIQTEDLDGSKLAKVARDTGDTELPLRPRGSMQSDDEDWIPSLPRVLRTAATHSSLGSSSPIRLVPPSPSKALNPSHKKVTMTPVITKLHAPVSMNKKDINTEVTYPTLPVPPLSATEAEISSSKSRDDLEASVAKKNQPTLISFAKQLFWGSPKPASPSKEAPQNLNSEGREDEARDEDTALNGILYPEMQASASLDLDEDLTPSEARQTPEKASKLQKGGLIKYGGVPKREVQLKGPSSAITEGINLIPENADDIIKSPLVSDNDPSLPGSPFFEAIASEEDDVEDENGDLPTNTNPRESPAYCDISPQAGSLREPRNRRSLQSKTNDLRKPNRALFGVKESGIAKPKAVLSSNRLITGSQREAELRRNGNHNPLSNQAALVNALAETFGPTKEPHSRPLSAMSSSSTHSRQAPKSIAALNSAAKAQKREQEEKERKAAQRQEMERKRQENLKREVRREEERKQLLAKAAKKQPSKTFDEEDVKKRIPTAGKGTQGIFHPSKLLPKATPFSHKSGLSSSKSQPELKRQPKRILPTEEENKLQKEEVNAKDSNQQDPKRRKTEDAGENPTPSTFAPPIRQSTAKKENLPPSKIGGIFSQDYTAAGQGQAHTLAKSALPIQLAKSTPLPQVEAVKYSHDKLKFGTMVTPSAQKIGRKLSTAPRESPVYPNPESIDLPEIHTDSEDDDDDKSFHVPKWADSPELRQALQDQLGIDPETIFGPIAPLSMEEIFRGRSDRAKFRARTSSANWSGADRLTTAEIEADRVERQRILDNGGWTYQKP
ncbi:hypothetical protein TWF970_009915 [Orbilia oligospora]|uniref:Inner centromere protein ARK-binding domain-containing protein n=1 Tax=Orbilia oligospora TaxID=2813651 RepID=A0A7C8R7J7_ORBOL|nr:hypothetical protein TWF970_009915 [Orbilia oligospora]